MRKTKQDPCTTCPALTTNTEISYCTYFKATVVPETDGCRHIFEDFKAVEKALKYPTK